MKPIIHIPYLSSKLFSDEEALIEALELYGAHLLIDKINWKSFPYRPLVSVHLAYSEEGLILHYFVRGLDLRTISAGDGHYVHTDSCVEFFMQREPGESYINFEFNAAGVCYASHHSSIKDSIPFSLGEYSSILRSATYQGKRIDTQGLHTWQILVQIPWSTMGYTSNKLPECLWGNFYKCGDDTAHPHYLSWAPIDEPSPAFHRPQFFGKLVLNKKSE